LIFDKGANPVQGIGQSFHQVGSGATLKKSKVAPLPHIMYKN
jgi:hypothetical protein